MSEEIRCPEPVLGKEFFTLTLPTISRASAALVLGLMAHIERVMRGFSVLGTFIGDGERKRLDN